MMRSVSATFFGAITSMVHARELIFALTWREVVGRYRGSFAGLLWSLLHPVFALTLYTFVFGIVFRARWGLQGESAADYALVLFAGLIVHGVLAECINRAPYLILGNPAYVKQVIFPLEILPLVALGSSLIHAVISCLLLLVVWAVVHGGIPFTVLFIPVLLIPLCLIALGLGWFISATAVYFRDLGQIVGFLCSGLLFISPIFYPAQMVPEPFRDLLYLNPLTYVIEHFRGALIHGVLPQAPGYLAFLAVSVAFAVAGYAWFQRIRPGFADSL
jgi:lipopolysaccharide transport system permease protein